MQDMLTASIEFLVIAFVLTMAFDFATDLKQLILMPVTDHSKCETKPEAIAPEPQDSKRPATLQWLEAMLSLSHNVEDLEVPNIFDLARDHQLHHQGPEVDTVDQPQQDYNSFTIRQLKKLASISKIKRYGAMSKRQLIEALAV